MKKYIRLTSSLMVCLMAVSCGGNNAPKDLMAEAEELQRSMLTLDTHCDTPMRLWSSSYDITKDNPSGCIDFPKMREGALDMECFAVFTSQRGRDTAFINSAYEKGLQTLDKIWEVAEQNSDIVGIAQCPDDMYALKKAGKLIIMPTVENSTIIGDDLSRLHTLYDKGIRMFGLCHSYNNDICDSSSDAAGPEFDGLSPLGEQVVAELNKIGAMIDVSHASDSTFYDVVRLSKTPIVASHSSVRSVANHDRNFDDNMLLALKENGGVIQICILDKYVKNFPVNEQYNAEMAAAREALSAVPAENTAMRDSMRMAMSQIKAKYPDQNAYVKDYVDHIEYVINKIGIDYVGIGTDFDGGGGVADCKDASQLVEITAELLRRGYDREQIEKIWGGNFIRVFNEVIAYKNSL